MKMTIRALVLASCTFGLIASSVEAAPKTPGAFSACSKVENVSNGLYVYKNSAPLRSGGVGTPLIGYREEPTLIMKRNNSSKGTTTIYDKKGKKIGSCPWATAHGFSGGRYRCTMSTRGLRRTAVKNTGSPNVFFKLKGTTCVEVPDAGKCYGSVKGKCNQTLK